jgi:diguanylate cyclase (GGDEF)-like protein
MGVLVFAAVLGGAVVLVAVVLVRDLTAWTAGGSPPWLPPAGLVAFALLIVGQGWPILPGRVGEMPTSGWSTVLCVALPLVAGSALSVAFAAVGGAVAMLAERSRAGHGRIAADIAGTAAAAAALSLVGAGSPATVAVDASGPVALGYAGVVVVAFAAGHLLTLAALDHGARPSPVRPVLVRSTREYGLALSVLVLLGPVVAVLLGSSAWLAAGILTVVTAIDVLVRAGRGPGDGTARDALTGLPSRQGLQEVIDRAVRLASTGGPPTALLVVDLDRFQEINDGHGHRTGDRVLRVVADRLLEHTRTCDVVARLGGDEFGVLVPGVRDVDSLVDLARRLRAALSERIEGRVDLFGPGASVGVAIAPDHAHTSSQLMARADLAVHAAKDSATGVRVYDGRSDQTSVERLGIVAAVRSALDSGSLDLAFQPKLALGPEGPGTDRMAGVEALLRLHEPGVGSIEPSRIVSLVEGTGLMGRLTSAVLDRALDQVASWLQAGERIPVAVNVSLRDLEDPDFAERAYSALVRAGVPGSLLTLEITERVLTGDLSAVVHSMERLERIGVQLSLDDFGTGWSSLLLLRSLPVAEVKLDRSFVAGIERDDADAAVVETVVALARRLGLTLVAEGVEQPEQLAHLRRFGCDMVQGYLVAAPLPAGDVVPWARRLGASRLRVVS